MIWRHDLSPYIFRAHILGFEIAPRWYGLAYAIGFLLGFVFIRSAIRRGRLPGLKQSDVEGLMVWLIAGVVLGGRLGYCVQNMQEFARDPLFFFKFNQGGMAFFGGLAGVALVLLIYSRRSGVGFARLGDACTIPAALGLGIGRIANFVNGELWGVPTDGTWGVIFPGAADNRPRHPSTLYEMATHFVLAGVLLWARDKSWAKKPGTLGGIFVLGYGILRVATEPFRAAETYVGPLTNGQVASLIIAVVGVGVIVWMQRRPVDEFSVETEMPSVES